MLGRFHGVERRIDGERALVLEGSPLWFTTRMHSQFTAGDHDVAVLEILDFGYDEASEGLVFHQSRFKGLTPLE